MHAGTISHLSATLHRTKLQLEAVPLTFAHEGIQAPPATAECTLLQHLQVSAQSAATYQQ